MWVLEEAGSCWQAGGSWLLPRKHGPPWKEGIWKTAPWLGAARCSHRGSDKTGRRPSPSLGGGQGMGSLTLLF